jgi:hypothetical protein
VEVVIGLIASLVAGIALILLSPLRRRLELWVVRRSGPSGLLLHIDADPADTGIGMTAWPSTQFYTSEAPPTLAPPSDGDHWWRWAHGLGGVDVGFTTLLITVQLAQDGAVVIDQPRVHWSRSETVPGHFLCPEGVGSGGVVPRAYRISINGGATVTYEDELDRPPSFTLAKGDTDRLLVSVAVGRGTYAWSLDIPTVSNGRRVVHHVDNNGKPFVTVGDEDVPTFMWSRDAWVPAFRP